MAKQFLSKRLEFARAMSGQAMVIFALTLPVLIGILGLGVDAAHVFNTRRDLQTAADLAALAGASQLPDDPAAASSIAADIAAENGFSGGSVSITVPYAGNDSQIEVEISEEFDLFFMPALGISSVSLSARAVASHEINTGTAVFAKKDYHCWEGTVSWPGSNISVDGTVHSNGGLYLSGNNNTVAGKLTYKVGEPVYPQDGMTSCAHDVYTYGTNPDIEIAEAPWQDWPVYYSGSDFPCTYDLGSDPDLERDGPWWVDGTMLPKKQLNPGVICYNGSDWLLLEEDGITGNVTFRAKKIDIGGANMNFTAYSNGVLFFSDSTSFPAIMLDPVGGRWEGMIYNRYGTPSDTVEGGQIRLTGNSGFELDGTIIGWAVTLGGGNWSIVGSQDPTYEPMRLVE